MIIILSKNKSLIKQLRKVDTISVVSNVFECKTYLETPDMECDILILDLDLVIECYDLFFDWIITKNLFIRNILIYYNTTGFDKLTQGFHKKILELKKARYNTSLIDVNKIVEGVKHL
jgi:hypothetical protein